MGEKIAVGADLKDGKVAIKGWLETSQDSWETFFDRMQALGGADGDLHGHLPGRGDEGANLALYRTLASRYSMDIIASSGGVQSGGYPGAEGGGGRRGHHRQGLLYRRHRPGPGHCPGGRRRTMITKRVIPCLDVKDGRVVKGSTLGLQDVSSPVELAEYFTPEQGRMSWFLRHHRLRRGAGPVSRHSAPDGQPGVHSLTVGGGINSLEDFDRVLKCGADKVSVNSGAIRSPDLIRQAALRYGSQCVVLPPM